MVANLQVAVAGVYHADKIQHLAVLYAAVGRFDKPVIVDACIAAQRRDQSNVRTFRRFNRADTSVVRGMYVAHFESSALTRQTARPKGDRKSVVRDLRQRIGLVHE